MMSSTINLYHPNFANLRFNLCLVISLPRQASLISLSPTFCLSFIHLFFTHLTDRKSRLYQTLPWPFSDAFYLSKQPVNICLSNCSVQFTIIIIICTAAESRLQGRGLTSRVSYPLDQHLKGHRSSRRRFADLLPLLPSTQNTV